MVCVSTRALCNPRVNAPGDLSFANCLRTVGVKVALSDEWGNVTACGATLEAGFSNHG